MRKGENKIKMKRNKIREGEILLWVTSPSRASAELNVLLFKVTKAGRRSGGKSTSGGRALEV